MLDLCGQFGKRPHTHRMALHGASGAFAGADYLVQGRLVALADREFDRKTRFS